MAVAYDAFSQAVPGTGNLSWTHTPVGTPRAIIVNLVQDANDTDQVSGAVYTYFLGSSIPTGAQTVDVTVSSNAEKYPCAVSLTGSADTEVVDVDVTIDNGAATNPSVTLSLGGRTCFAMISFFSGRPAPTDITPLANWTVRREQDFGSSLGGIYTYDVIGTTDVTAGWTQTSDAGAAIALAISEVSASTGKSKLVGSSLITSNLLRRLV
jgi:hypothetical protein